MRFNIAYTVRLYFFNSTVYQQMAVVASSNKFSVYP